MCWGFCDTNDLLCQLFHAIYTDFGVNQQGERYGVFQMFYGVIHDETVVHVMDLKSLYVICLITIYTKIKTQIMTRNT